MTKQSITTLVKTATRRKFLGGAAAATAGAAALGMPAVSHGQAGPITESLKERLKPGDRAMTVEQTLKRKNIVLPPVGPPMGSYVHAKRVGELLFLAGKGPRYADGAMPRGKLGAGMTVEQGYKHARQVGLVLIAAMKEALGGDLERVTGIVKVLGMVNAAPDFEDHPKVINGCSDLFVEVFGELGKHARSAVGVGSLPSGIPVEIEVVVAVK